ncbi:basic 7S globulin-like [Cucumis melo var. makuwa]|uniref:Basic 7S globulin-like n=1 Tax=Cucumis melo var. makuwa TaxID=1194695 RepID=A0A5A7TCR4_CUCMM|nr:basic 7S globulin-like [Cucumis melo var. makuwa]TYK16043.1 basic 7S globulin-like [Cucumis melo var. makuwa]
MQKFSLPKSSLSLCLTYFQSVANFADCARNFPWLFPILPSFLLLLSSLTLFHGETFSLVILLTKDFLTNQYLATVFRGSLIKPVHLAIDLGGRSLWMAYGGSSSSCSIPIRSIQCGLSGGACNVITGNPFGDLEGKAILVENTVAVRSLGRPTATVIVALHFWM